MRAITHYKQRSLATSCNDILLTCQHNDLTSQRKLLTSQHKDLTSEYNDLTIEWWQKYVTIPNWFWEQSDLDIGQIFSFIRFDQFSNKLNWKFMVSSIRRNTHKIKHHQNVTLQIHCLQIALITNTNHLIKIISYTDLQWHWSIWICLQITIWPQFHIFDILF